MAVDRVVFKDPTFTRMQEGQTRNVTVTFLADGVPTNPGAFYYRIDNVTNRQPIVEWTPVSTIGTSAVVTIPQLANKMASNLRDTEKRQLVIAGPDGKILGTLNWQVENLVGFDVGDSFPVIPPPSGGVAPVIVTQPSDILAEVGTNQSLTVVATGAVSYVWRHDSGSGWQDLVGWTTATLLLGNIQTSSNGPYQVECYADDGTSVVSITVTVNVGLKPQFTVHPPSSYADTVGSNVLLTATSLYASSYQWQKNGGNIAGETGASLSITNAQTTDSGSYQRVDSNIYGITTSSACALTISVPSVEVIPDILPGYIPMPSHFVDEFDNSDNNHSSHKRDYWIPENGTGALTKPAGVLTMGSTTYTNPSVAEDQTNKYQGRSDWVHNFFTGPREFHVDTFAHTGGLNSSRRYRYVLVPERADEYAGLANPDFYATSAAVIQIQITGVGTTRIWLGFKENATSQTPLNSALPGNTVPLEDYQGLSFMPTSFKLIMEATNYRLELYNGATLGAVLRGAHGLTVANWGRRGDTHVVHENVKVNDNTVDPAVNTVTINEYSADGLLLYDGFNSTSIGDAGMHPNFWQQIANSTPTNPPTHTGLGIGFALDATGGGAWNGYLSPLSKMYNFFTQDLEIEHYFQNTAPDAATRAVWSMSEQAGILPALANYGLTVTLDNANNLRISKKTSGLGWAEDIGTIMNTYNGTGTIIGFRLALTDRTTWTLTAITSTFATEAAGTGSHGLLSRNWGPLTWASAGDIPNNGDSAVFIGTYGDTATTADTTSHRDTVIRRTTPFYVADSTKDDGIPHEIPTVTSTWTDQTRLQYGIVDPAYGPFNADPEGNVVCTAQFDHCRQFAKYWSMRFAPSAWSTDYVIDDMLQEIADLRYWTTDASTLHPVNHDMPATWHGGKTATVDMPTVRLKDGSRGFEGGATTPPKEMVYFWAREDRTTSGPDHYRTTRSNVLMSHSCNNIKFVTGNNAGAIALNQKGAQGCSNRDLVFDVAGGHAAYSGIPAAGGDTVNTTITGGKHALAITDLLDYMGGTTYRDNSEGADTGPSVHGLTCSGQTDEPILWYGRGPMFLEGVNAQVANGKNFIKRATSGWASSITMNLSYMRDYHISYPSIDPTNIPIYGNRSIKCVRGWVTNAASMAEWVSLPSGQTAIPTALGAGTYSIERYEQGIDGVPYAASGGAVTQFRSRRWVNGVVATRDGGWTTASLAVPTDLVSKNIPAGTPHIDDVGAVYLSLTDAQRRGEVDSAGAVNTSIGSLSAGEFLVMPKARYDDSATIAMAKDTKIVGVGRNLAEFMPIGETGSYAGGSPGQIFTVPNTADGDAMLVDIGIQAPVNYRYTEMLKCEGKLQIVHCSTSLRNAFGYGGATIPAVVNTGLKQLQWWGANAEGHTWGLNNGEHWRQRAATRFVYMNGTRKRIEHHIINKEHGLGDANNEFDDCQNFVVGLYKCEGIMRIGTFKNCDNFAVQAVCGNAQAFPKAHTPNEDTLVGSYPDQAHTRASDIAYATVNGDNGLLFASGSGNGDSPNYTEYPSTAQPIPGGEAHLVSSLIKIDSLCDNYEIGPMQTESMGDMNGGGTNNSQLQSVFGNYYAAHRWPMVNADGTLTKAGYPADNEKDCPVGLIENTPTVLTQG